MSLRNPFQVDVGAAVLLAAAAVLTPVARGQGTFKNLDFELPITPLTPVNSQVPTADGLPGWTAYTYGSPQSSIVYNTVSLGAAAVSLQGPGSSWPSLQGSYMVILQGSSGGTPGSAAIGQTGQIPLAARSLIFWGSLNDVSFGGQTLPFFQLGATPNYNIYGADISALAGRTGELLFTAAPTRFQLLDNIQFSTQPIPEPSIPALTALTACFLGRALTRRRS